VRAPTWLSISINPCLPFSPRCAACLLLTELLKLSCTRADAGSEPKVKIATMYIDQPGGFPSSQPTPFEDLPMGIRMAEKYGVKLVNSIREALCTRPDGTLPPPTGEGADEVTVDGILAIGEHGDYPWNAQEQHLYPRRHFFEQICGVLSKSPRRHEVPIFTDKFLANTWDDALWIYQTGRELGLVHMAGSSVPNCFHRDPWLEHPIGTDIEDALMLSYGGLESYGYHGLEALQAMIERRRGGEAGIVAVQCLEGEAIWDAAEAGRWSMDLAQAALEVVELRQPTSMAGASGPPPTELPPLREAVGCDDKTPFFVRRFQLPRQTRDTRKGKLSPKSWRVSHRQGVALFLVECADGFRCALLHAQDSPNFELTGQQGTSSSVVAGWACAFSPRDRYT
jgi:hypothetical protein